MNRPYSLGLRRNSFKAFLERLISDSGAPVDLADWLPVGDGRRVDDLNTSGRVIVGVGTLFKGVFNNRINDLDVVRTGVALYHELTYYHQDVNGLVSVEDAIGSLSGVGNKTLYELDRLRKPHEVQAEYTGVMSMWSVSNDVYGDDLANKCIVDYLNSRCNSVIETYYFERDDTTVFVVSENLKRDVEDAFEQAYDRSLNGERHIVTNLSKLSDESARLVSPGSDFRDSSNKFAPFYVSFYNSRQGI